MLCCKAMAAPHETVTPPHPRRTWRFAFGLVVPLAVLVQLVVGCERGSGTPAQQERDVRGFTRVDVGGAFEVDIEVGPAFRVVVHADDNLVDRVITEVDGDTLEIHLPGSVSTKAPLRAEISMPSLAGVDVSGATKADIDGVTAEELELEASGASHIVARGKAGKLDAEASGATQLDTRELKAAIVRIDVSGASKAEVTATEALDADASGSSTIRYFGAPASVRTDTSGASTIDPG